MAKQNQLSAAKVRTIKERGNYCDGLGLWLQVSKWGTKSWVFRFTLQGKSREMGLGALHTVSLAEAREQARDCRQLLRDGIDPIEDRKRRRAEAGLADQQAITFDECAKRYIAAHKAGWRNPKHAAQWEATLNTYCTPVFGGLPVAAVDTALVMRALEPIWTTKTETASRVRGRLENVLSWATVHGYRQGENPARWRGHLDKLLPQRSKVAKVEHHPALPYAELPAFVADLRGEIGVAAAALEFTILTATRTTEVLQATWEEFADHAWTIPGSRTKSGRDHRVPLTKPAEAILARMRELNSEWVFPGHKEGKHLSNTAMLAVLKRMGRGDLTVHGFRSTFRDWAAEKTRFPNEVAEMALAHVVRDKTEAAYRRGDLFAKRRKLMAQWAKYVQPGKPTPNRSGTDGKS